jgi:phage shock protein A
MNRVKRWTLGIFSSFDRMISQVENHEAIVNSAIKEVTEAAARAKVQLARVQKDGTRMRHRLNELREENTKWRERALKAAALDEQRALECMRRTKRTEQQIKHLEQEERSHARLETQLGEDLKKVGERLLKLKDQRNLLRTRQSRAEALRAAQDPDTVIISDLEDIFDRWETKIAEYELQGTVTAADEDVLAQEYQSQEEEFELREELKRLIDAQ